MTENRVLCPVLFLVNRHPSSRKEDRRQTKIVDRSMQLDERRAMDSRLVRRIEALAKANGVNIVSIGSEVRKSRLSRNVVSGETGETMHSI